MSTASIRKLANMTDAYEVKGSPREVKFGRRRIADLTVRSVHDDRNALSPLADLADLRFLRLERVSSVDLSPLAGLGIESLEIAEVSHLDLEPIADLPALDALVLQSISECTVPNPWPLPASLRALSFSSFGAKAPASMVAELLSAVAWEALPQLVLLDIALGDGSPGAPLRHDFSFLRHLPLLESLSLWQGVRHSGENPSPLEPPFSGLPRGLRRVHVAVAEPAVVEPALMTYLGWSSWPADAGPGVVELEPLPDPAPDPTPGDSRGSFMPHPPDANGEPWSMYGSVYDALDDPDVATEYDALELFKKRLATSDPKLLSRLEFDQEADGTGIEAPTLAELQSVRRHLGFT